MAAPSNHPLVRKLTRAVKADPKKSIFLGALLAVMLVLVVRGLCGGAASPAHAFANASPHPAIRQVIQSASADSHGPGSPETMLEWTQTSISALSRNLFAVDLDYFPQDSSQMDQTLRVTAGNGFWDELEKSMIARTEEKKVRQKLIDELRYEAAQIHVETTMMGSTPKAMVNGSLVTEGDAVALFRVVKITARGIIVERDGIKLEVLFR